MRQLPPATPPATPEKTLFPKKFSPYPSSRTPLSPTSRSCSLIRSPPGTPLSALSSPHQQPLCETIGCTYLVAENAHFCGRCLPPVLLTRFGAASCAADSYDIFNTEPSKMWQSLSLWRVGNMGRGLRGWVDDFREAKRQRALLAKGMGSLLHMHLARAFRKWRSECQNSIGLLGKAVAFMMKRDLCKGWNSWREWYEEQLATKALMGKSLLFMMKRDLCKGWNSWREWYEEQLDTLALMGKSLLFMMKRDLCKGWNSWREWYDRILAQIALMGKSLHFMQNIALSRAWNKWRLVFDEAQDKMNKALRAMQNMALARAWRKWRECFEGVMLNAANLWMNLQLARGWRGWRVHYVLPPGAHAPEDSRYLDELLGDPKCREATEIILQRAHEMNKRRDAYLKNLQKEMGN